ncbi:hypothetical protein C0J52_20336 [Blattella germanica]|nr:hypothetical protein C0J52_20336 [Blattella germanica]
MRVIVKEPIQVKSYTWCLKVPPRCTKYKIEMRDKFKIQIAIVVPSSGSELLTCAAQAMLRTAQKHTAFLCVPDVFTEFALHLTRAPVNQATLEIAVRLNAKMASGERIVRTNVSAKTKQNVTMSQETANVEMDGEEQCKLNQS